MINPIKAFRWMKGDEQLLGKMKADAEQRLRAISEVSTTRHGIHSKYRVEIGATDQEITNTAE